VAISTGNSGGTAVKSDINVTPMIDVMLVLLIIFMIVTPLIAAGFRATLPKGKNLDPRPEGENEVVLGIDESGRYFLNGRALNGGVDALEDQLRGIFSARTEDKILYFKADNHLKYAKVQEAVETARKAGVRVMAAITEPNRNVVLGGVDEKKKEKK
jgi:biopolymer transport protein TolR